MRKSYLQIAIAIVITTLAGLTTHIIVQKWTFSLLVLLGHRQAGSLPQYSTFILTCAYLTALAPVSVMVFLYYHAGHLLKFNSLLKVLILTGLILEISGDLIRQPVMNYIVMIDSHVENALYGTLLVQLDSWITHLVISIYLVFGCPTRHSAAPGARWLATE